MINNDSIVTAYDEHLTLVEWLQKVEVLLKNGGLKETILNDKGNATFSLTLVFNDGTKLESNVMTLQSVNTALASVNTSLTNLGHDIDTATHRIDDLEDEVDNKTIPLFDKYSIIVPNDSADTNILPCTPSDNGKVLSVVNGEAQWASGGNDINVLTVNGDTFTGSIKQDKINLIKLNDNTSLVGIGFVSNYVNMLFGFAPDMDRSMSMTGNLRAHILIENNDENNDENTYQSIGFNLAYYSHFITITSSTSNTSVFFCAFQNNSRKMLNTLDSLKAALARRRLPCTGHTDTGIAEFISVGGESIVVGVVDKSGNSTSDIIIDSSFIINDLVSPVE